MGRESRGSHYTIFLLALILASACREKEDPYTTWRVYSGDYASTQYSSLDQINTTNVGQLEIAWQYHTGDLNNGARGQIQCNPIIIDDVLYATSPMLRVFALKADTGEEIWTFNPFENDSLPPGPAINRGVVYWEDERGRDARILFTAGSNLFALDAGSGRPIRNFGQDGTVDLHDGLDRNVSGFYVQARTPGIVYRDMLILGSTLSEGPATAPGHIRSYNVRTGQIEWIFHTIPHPGEFGYDTWPPDAYQRSGGANAWSGLSLDEERGIVFLPTGSAAFDFWGGDRHGQNLFANSVLALSAETGERIWHYQVVHHDLWDHDLPAAPNLVTIEHDGSRIDAVAQITKSGHVFVLDRESGEPLFPVEERPVPKSDLMGEETWPTQPFPTMPPPFSRQYFSEDSLTDVSPEARASVVERFGRLRSDGPFTPPSQEGSMIFPGMGGGAQWGGAAFDPTDGTLYINANEMPRIIKMVDLTRQGDRSSGRGLYTIHCAGCHAFDLSGSSDPDIPSMKALNSRLDQIQARQVIEHGLGFMPSFGFLSEPELDSIVDFLFNGNQFPVEPLAQELQEIADDFAGSPYGFAEYMKFVDKDGYPAVKPPWGTLTKIDLNSGEIVWAVRFGEFDELTARGIPATGTENYGGPVVTSGGLLFIGATKDERFRAFDKESGEILWETRLPAGGYATPATYEVGGRQYVVIAAGGGKMGTRSGDSYIAFALPTNIETP